MVDADLFAAYQRALGANADLAKAEVARLVARLGGMTPQQQALFLMRNYPALVRQFGSISADVARQFYQDARDAHFEGDEDATDYTAQAAKPVQTSWAQEDLQKASRDGIDTLPGIAVRRVMQRADQTISLNATRDPAHPRWAIVPHPGACGWCVMVSSNGWAYSERGVNAQRHDNCKCSVCVDWDTKNPTLAGYDPDALRRRYRQGVEDAGDTWAKWQALTPEERARYQRKGRSAYDVFKTTLIARAMEGRG